MYLSKLNLSLIIFCEFQIVDEVVDENIFFFSNAHGQDAGLKAKGETNVFLNIFLFLP